MSDELVHLKANFAKLTDAVGVAKDDMKAMADKLAVVASASVINPADVQAVADQADALATGLAAAHAAVTPAPAPAV